MRIMIKCVQKMMKKIKMIKIIYMSFLLALLLVTSYSLRRVIPTEYLLDTNMSILLTYGPSLILTYIVHRFFGLSSFRIYIFRRYIQMKSVLSKTNNILKYKNFEDVDVLPMQEKAIKLWKMALRDKSSSINCSLSDKSRQVESGSLLMILSSINEMDSIMTIMDVDDKKSYLYEVRMGNKITDSISEYFDEENRKRIDVANKKRKDLINNNLDRLISNYTVVSKG